jgi:hypothetical protein
LYKQHTGRISSQDNRSQGHIFITCNETKEKEIKEEKEERQRCQEE